MTPVDLELRVERARDRSGDLLRPSAALLERARCLTEVVADQQIVRGRAARRERDKAREERDDSPCAPHGDPPRPQTSADESARRISCTL